MGAPLTPLGSGNVDA